jgi:lipoprotein-releasing system ATP-binding protein
MSEAQVDLRALNLTKTFPTAAGELVILQNVNLEMRRGHAVSITGPSGSGKSTLLYIIGTLDRPTAGRVEILGQNPFDRSEKAMARFRNESIGFIFQDHHLLPQCSVLENVLIPALAGAGVGDAALDRAKKLLERVGLAERLTHRPAQLSGGERQRVGICRALINEPVLLLADEPTGNLDQKTADSIGSLLLEIAGEQNTLLICVTHSQDLARRFPDRQELKEGRLIPSGG